MDVKELMIGDWVKVLPISRKVEAHNSQVGALTRNVDNTISIEGGYFPAWKGWSVSEDYIEPIPLTLEILELNGFEKIQDIDGFIVYDYCFHTVFWDRERELIELLVCWDYISIRYVHELQRALRCCGLWDLANNFKVN